MRSRELTPVITAIIMAGRVGSAIAAELGTMQVSEQTDTLRVLKTDPVDYLVRAPAGFPALRLERLQGVRTRTDARVPRWSIPDHTESGGVHDLTTCAVHDLVLGWHGIERAAGRLGVWSNSEHHFGVGTLSQNRPAPPLRTPADAMCVQWQLLTMLPRMQAARALVPWDLIGMCLKSLCFGGIVAVIR